ncbi:MAG: cytochrome c3 family protein [Proteobacteria bacterium]|nr:cytochrome c3 family protein [Pseudomonadota bacterium]
MKFLIRFITRNAAGGVEYNDKIIDATTITMGRATDQTLHLRDKRVRLQHARIEADAGQVRLTTGTQSGVTVNGRSQTDARLVVGDVVEIGSNVLKVIATERGAGFAFSFELSSDASAEHFVADWSSDATGLAGWSKRRLSWTIAAVVLLLAAVLPSLNLLSKNVLQAGPIHAAHSSIGEDCSTCHVTPFQRVPDAACVACHSVARHVAVPDDDNSGGEPGAVLGEVRCATCHLEHNEPPQLVNQHQALCADCHASSEAGGDLEIAADFLDLHPEFSISLLQAPEETNLQFDHATHLDAAGIVTPDGRRVVECVECHVAETGGARMLPISMVDHCSGCHTLAFDPDEPTREVPHGNPADVLQTLLEYYSARLLGADADAVEQRVRRPGQTLTRADRDRAAAEARVQALKVAEDLFLRRACANCHVVSVSDSGAAVPWDVAPVKLTTVFLPQAGFTHAAHRTEVTSCDGCHKASTSTSADDSLIPDIDSCRTCHGSGIASRNNAAQIPSTCVMCHSFHVDALGLHP